MQKDIIAILLVGAGSSFGRAPTEEQAIEKCAKTAVADWSSMFDLAGKEATINLFDVTGHDNIFWDMNGVHPKDDPEKNLPKLGERKVTLPAKRRRR